MARQIRLDDDVAAELDRLADRDGGSVASQGNRTLRQALGLGRSDPEPDIDRPVQRASIGRSRAVAGPGSCPHPPARRRGRTCLACGRIVVGSRQEA